MALIFRMPPQQFIKFEPDTNNFINEATKGSIQESIQESMVSYAQLSCAYCWRSFFFTKGKQSETIKGI